MHQLPLIEIFSFGYQKSGIPADPSGNNGGYVFDCRALPNPHYIETLRPFDGRDEEIIDYFGQFPQVAEFISRTVILVADHAQSFAQIGYAHLMVCYGCTGGHHRSVFCAEQAAIRLREAGWSVKITHVELERDLCAQ